MTVEEKAKKDYFKISKGNYSDLSNQMKWLENKITERISDLSEIKSMQGDRHAFCYYRKLVQEMHSDLTTSMEVLEHLNNKQ